MSETIFIDDPLRLIRAYRISGELGLRINTDTAILACRDAGLITNVSPERVRDELYRILEGGSAHLVFLRMMETGLLNAVLPEVEAMAGLYQGGPHRYDLMEHSLKAMEYAGEVASDPERFFPGHGREITEYLSVPVDGILRMRGLAVLAAFMHDVGKPSTKTFDGRRNRFLGHDEAGAAIVASVSERLKMSTRAAIALQETVKGHMRPFHLLCAREQPVSRRALYRLCRDAGGYIPGLAVVSLADSRATDDTADWDERFLELWRRILDFRTGEYAEAVTRPFVTGDDLINVFGMRPGPAFREILGAVEEMRAAGDITDRDGALEYIRGMLSGGLPLTPLE